MEVILKQDVEKLGREGSVVKVKRGYARNFLIPNNLAMPLTSSNLKKLEQEKQRRASRLEKLKRESQQLTEKLASVSVTISALTQEEDKLYGSITPQDIQAALKEEGFNIEKDSIILDEPIKSLGIYEIPIRLHPEAQTKIKLWVVKK